MRACVLHAVGDLRCETVECPQPGPGEALLRVSACGVCGSDVPRVFTKGTYTFPTIPGHEFAGIVEQTGSPEDAGLIGKAFAVFPLIPCRRCAMCVIEEYAMCQNYDYIGSRRDGAFAEYVCAPAWNLVPVPEGVPLDAAAMTEPAAVAAHALHQGEIRPGDTVFIAGAGPIGLIIAMWARARDATKILLTDIDERQLALANSLGFPHTHNPKEGPVEDWVRGLDESGTDIAIEAAGVSASLEACLKVTGTSGRVVLMGNPAGDMRLPQDAYWTILRRQLTLRGTWNSEFRQGDRNDWRRALRAMQDGHLDLAPLITHRVDLEGLPAAMETLRDRSEFINKVMYTARD